MPEQWLSITETARLAGLPELTARRYANDFDDYLPNRNFGRCKKYPPDAVQVLLRIENLYREGYDTNQISDALSRELYTVILTEDGRILSTAEALAVMSRVVAEHSRVLQKLAGIMEKMAAAIQEIAANQEIIMNKEKTPAGCRDNWLAKKPGAINTSKWLHKLVDSIKQTWGKGKTRYK